MKRRFVIDIETIPQPLDTLAARMPEFEAPKNFTDPEKIKAAITKKSQEWLDRAALSWHTAQVVLVGWGEIGGKFLPINFDSEDLNLEMAIGLIAAELADGNKVGGHNVKGFDLPILINRARVHGIAVPSTIVRFGGRYPIWNEDIFDTYEMTFGNVFDGNGVDDLARTFGLPPKLGSGADFPALWMKDRQAAIDYNRRDVEIEMLIAERLGV